MSAASNQRLFVYGTLAPGEANAHVLEPLMGNWQPAVAKGSLHAQGWGASYGFPAMRLNPDGEDVQGLLFTAASLASCWSELDEFEGDAYQRVLTHVTLDDGRKVEANVYVLNDS